ncbi:MAG: glycosyltransferase family 4 protein, partial [Pirellulaceae bacterium]
LSRQAMADLESNNALVAVSHATRDFHIAQGVSATRVHVVYNGVDPESFKPGIATGSLQRELGIPATSRCILFTGQIGLRKGLDTWLQAAKIIARTKPDCHFVVVGTRQSGKQESIEYEERLVKQSHSGVLGGRVHWLGERTDVARLMQESSILMHCANQEPLGRVLLEAFASGLPAVATNVGGTPEIFSGPVLSDLLCPPKEPGTVAVKAIELLEDSGLYRQVSAQQREVAICKFPVDRNAATLTEIYHSMT